MGTPINPSMREGRYQDTLRRFRARIAAGLSFSAEDSTFPGDKYTSTAWGLCSCEDEMAYPEANDHTFPTDFVQHQRLSPRDPPEGATCPFDRGLQKPDPMNPGAQGCFYRCRIFKPNREKVPSREEALQRYDDLIAARETKYGKRTTADDDEGHWAW